MDKAANCEQDALSVPINLPPHLVSNGDVKCCSVCKEEFRLDAQPSLSWAFAKHIREAHPAKSKGATLPRLTIFHAS